MAKTLSGNWNYPTKIMFGEGVLAKLPQLCRDLAIQKPLLVTDEGLAESDIVKAALKINADAGITTALIGASRASQVEDCVRAIDNLDFTPEELAEIDTHAQEEAINIWARSSEEA